MKNNNLKYNRTEKANQGLGNIDISIRNTSKKYLKKNKLMDLYNTARGRDVENQKRVA